MARESALTPPDLADALTYSRFAAGAALLAYAALPPSRRRTSLALGVFAWGVVSDWVDGTIARRRGATAWGAALDREADSLLTLGSAFAALAAGGLGRAALLPPAMRYPLAALRSLVRQGRDDDEERWDRGTGVLQMALFLLALSPDGRARRLARALAPPVTALRTAALAAQLERCARAASSVRDDYHGHQRAPRG